MPYAGKKYFCNNHNLSIENKKLIFGNKSCKGKVDYNIINEEFYLINIHNNICDNKNIKF